MPSFEIIATIDGRPGADLLQALVSRGVTIFRVNGAHVRPHELARYANRVRDAVGRRARLLVDLPGNKIRTAGLAQPIRVERGQRLQLYADQFNYPQFLALLQPGDELLAADSLLHFEVLTAGADSIVVRSASDGFLPDNKGVHLARAHPDLPFLFERDVALLAAAVEHDFDLVGLSFVRRPDDVEMVRRLLGGREPGLVVKIETRQALEHLDEILERAEMFLIDRGDLSCDVGVEQVAFHQRRVVRAARARGRRIFLATQFLQSMVSHNIPLIAEACGVAEAIEMGVDGIQLADETAIGQYPLEAVDAVVRIRAFVQTCRPALRIPRGAVLWLTGRSGSGKTTLAVALKHRIETAGLSCALIDGDAFRAFWDHEAGFTREARVGNQKNLIFAAAQAAAAFDVTIVASLSPYAELRQLARRKIPTFHEIYVDCSHETCVARDPKGHYRRVVAETGETFIGVTEEYEVPVRPDLVVRTDGAAIGESLAELERYVFGEWAAAQAMSTATTAPRTEPA